MFWFYWDTAWSVIISGIMFVTIVAHPDAEVREIGDRELVLPHRGRARPCIARLRSQRRDGPVALGRRHDRAAWSSWG